MDLWMNTDPNPTSSFQNASQPTCDISDTVDTQNAHMLGMQIQSMNLNQSNSVLNPMQAFEDASNFGAFQKQAPGIYQIGANTMALGSQMATGGMPPVEPQPPMPKQEPNAAGEVSEAQQQQMLFEQQIRAQQIYQHQLYAQQIYQQQVQAQQQQQMLQLNNTNQFVNPSNMQFQSFPQIQVSPNNVMYATDPTAATGQRTGTVNRWFIDKRSGWIRGDDGINLFVHYTDVLGNRQDLQEGERVTYFLGWNQKVQKQKAELVKPLVEHPSPPKQVTTMPLQGKVARWDEDKNFGFIAYSTGSVFVHHSDLIGQEKLSVGQHVSFEIVVNASCGKHKAVRVSVIGDENTDIDIVATTLSSMPTADSSLQAHVEQSPQEQVSHSFNPF